MNSNDAYVNRRADIGFFMGELVLLMTETLTEGGGVGLGGH